MITFQMDLSTLNYTITLVNELRATFTITVYCYMFKVPVFCLFARKKIKLLTPQKRVTPLTKLMKKFFL